MSTGVIHEREYHIACGAVVCEPLVLIGRAGGRYGVGMPVAELLKPVCAHILYRGKLFSRVKGEVLLGVVGIGEDIHLFDDLVIAVDASRYKSAGFNGSFFFAWARIFS